MGEQLKDIDLYKVYCNWVSGTADFRCFFHSANFVSLKHYTNFELPDIKTDDTLIHKICELTDGYNLKETLTILDLPGSNALDAAYGLRECKNLRPILLFNGVLHPNGLIGDREYITRLLGYGRTAGKNEADGFVLILDSQRYGEYDDEQYKLSFNNQYELGEEDLPSIEMLKEAGYKSVLFIFDGCIKEDAEAYLDYLKESDLTVYEEELRGAKNENG